MSGSTPRYAIVTPARDESKFIEETLRSVTSQSIPPTAWVIVDDGSTDGTQAIVNRYADRFGFIRLLQLGEREYGDGKDRLSWGTDAVVFNLGLATLQVADYDYIVKLDADLRFDPDYFERLFAEFDTDPSLGIAGGHLYDEVGDQLVLERVPDWHVRGATKVYRRACFEEIGGVLNLLGWDGVDEAQAYLRGWRSRAFYDPSGVHLRPQGASGGGLLRGRARLGFASYLLRYHPIWVLVRSLRIATFKPYVIGGGAYIVGYLQGFIQRPPRLEDREAAAYIRRSQMGRLVGIRPYVLPEADPDR